MCWSLKWLEWLSQWVILYWKRHTYTQTQPGYQGTPALRLCVSAFVLFSHTHTVLVCRCCCKSCGRSPAGSKPPRTVSYTHSQSSALSLSSYLLYDLVQTSGCILSSQIILQISKIWIKFVFLCPDERNNFIMCVFARGWLYSRVYFFTYFTTVDDRINPVVDIGWFFKALHYVPFLLLL